MLTLRTLQNKETEIIYKELSYELCGIFYRVYDELGRYARENQYCDLIEKYLNKKEIPYKREKLLSATGIDKNKADFIVDDKMVLEIKVIPYPTKKDYYQIKRYLRLAKLKLGILVNFRQQYLKPKRILNSDI